MWDLTGMEYYWGILPELAEAFLMWILNTASMMPFRLMNAAVGSMSVGLIYGLIRKFFHNTTASSVGAILVAMWPSILVFNTYGLTETLGIFFLLVGLWFYERREYVCGLALGFASMCRIEYWFLTLGFLACYLIFERSSTRFVAALIGWFTPMAPYMWHLNVHTGNPLYPVYWNFFGAALGGWTEPYTISSTTIVFRTIWLGIAVIGCFFILWLARNKKPSYPVYVLFLGYLAFQGVLALISLRGELVGTRYILDRFMMLDFIFMSILLSLLPVKISRVSKKMVKNGLRILYVSLIIALYITAFNAFIPLYTAQSEMSHYFEVADSLADRYDEGVILCNIPMMNYRLIDDGISYQNILGTIYIPRDDFSSAMNWFKAHGVRWFVVTNYSYDDSNRLMDFLRSTNERLPFELVYSKGIIYIYTVTSDATS